MRIVYSFFLLLVTLCTNAQTNPTAQPLPYTQDFASLAAAYPAGWQGWTISTIPGSTFNVAPATLDRVLVTGATAATNSGNINNYVGKLGFLNTGSLDLGLVVAVVTTGQSNIPVSYDVMTIRNPYDGTTNTRVNEITLQYRVGTAGNFTNLTGIEYQNNTTTQITAVTTPQNLVTKTITLPAACDNQPVVQLRWASRQVTGGGARPSFAIDNISIGGGGADVTPPTVTTLTPADDATNVSIGTSLNIVFSEGVAKGTGNIVIKKLSDNSIVQTIDVTTAAVSVTGNAATITINPLQLTTGYYVEIAAGAFKDLANNNFAGITGNTTWNFATGSAIYSADFNTCTASLTDGFTQYSVTGPQVWACTTFGHGTTPTGSAPNGVQINGFAAGSNIINEDWLISPSLNLVSTTYPLLSFWSRTAFNGAPLKLKVSTNYTGTGDPALAIWTDLTGNFPLLATDVWTLSQNINLTAFKTANTYIAFVYNSTADDGARWTLDDVKIDNSLTPPPATLTPNTGEINFGYVANGSTLVKTMNFTGNDITGGVTLTATGNFLISKTNGSFTPSISYTQAEANNINKTVFVQFAPTAPTVSYTGTLMINTPTVADTILILKGNSIDAATTLEVVNWNIEWFGSTTLGPTNNNLQEQNVKTVLQNVGADVYALVEVVDEARLANIVNQMPGYSYVLSNYGSYTNPFQAGAGPLSESQKLGLVYKTALFPGGLTTQALLSAGINTAADVTNPAYNWYASGRFPFMVTGTTTLNGVTKQIRFVITHAKANTSPTLTSYARRKAGNDSLRIHLNTFYPNDNIIFLGDFNDDLDSTITAGITPKLSSYKQFTDDAANFYSPTLALSLAGKKSTVSYNDVIDHVMLSNEMQCSYMLGTAAILTDVAGLIPNYGTTTTDHYPVFTRYLFVQPQAATLSYAGSPYCSSAGTANATFTGTTGGVYSSTAGLSISATTGAINLSASTAGTYVITYTLAANGVCNPLFTTTANVTITTAPAATIAYAGSPYCSNIATATVTRTGTTGGVYSSTTGLSINATTGDVNIATSTAGTYTVTYTVAAAGGCALFTTTTSITITTAPAATITYGTAPYCSNSGTANVTRTGTTGGVYSSTAGLSINATTGAVTLATSTAGTYTVTYTVASAGGCATFTTTASITITAAASATINYAGSPYCQAATIATVTRTGNAGGVYSSTTGLVINATTGDVDVAASTAGTYVVTYNIAANAGCTAFTATANITINSNSVAPTSATVSTTLICANSGTVNLTANGGTLGSGASYKWYSGTCGGTLVGTGTTLSNVSLNTTTTYFVRIEGTCNTTACQSITVVVATQPVVEITVAPPTGVTPTSPVTIIATVSPSGTYNYLWTKNNTTNLSTNADRIIVSADEAGNYKVKVTSASGCTATSVNAFVSSAASAKLFISANPNRGVFNVSYNNGAANLTARTLNIYDSKGARVFTQTYNNSVPFSNMKVNMTAKGKGTYFVELVDATGKKLADDKVLIF
jgi:Bacterial Ig-like domain/Ig-like domain CHU_C associated